MTSIEFSILNLFASVFVCFYLLESNRFVSMNLITFTINDNKKI